MALPYVEQLELADLGLEDPLCGVREDEWEDFLASGDEADSEGLET